ncbi:hypothetical protein BDA96_04G302200 [Sorghum bicolor]|uniref:Uncharacterized protein n=2 Tax=Sorghum bicolor TaxID=4558 RepID=A0A921UJR9_SORBI|nr:hypothetical protein BDA96_04G302200 [Sorghum bicolor]OQU85642.1 hypothetical protein SORBI_3004G283550 [Sorghum bicolor]
MIKRLCAQPFGHDDTITRPRDQAQPYHLSDSNVIFRGTFWIRHWSLLSKEEERRNLNYGCRYLEGAALQLFSSWKHYKRIEV